MSFHPMSHPVGPWPSPHAPNVPSVSGLLLLPCSRLCFSGFSLKSTLFIPRPCPLAVTVQLPSCMRFVPANCDKTENRDPAHFPPPTDDQVLKHAGSKPRQSWSWIGDDTFPTEHSWGPAGEFVLPSSPAKPTRPKLELPIKHTLLSKMPIYRMPDLACALYYKGAIPKVNMHVFGLGFMVPL